MTDTGKRIGLLALLILTVGMIELAAIRAGINGIALKSSFLVLGGIGYRIIQYFKGAKNKG